MRNNKGLESYKLVLELIEEMCFFGHYEEASAVLLLVLSIDFLLMFIALKTVAMLFGLK